jgi:Na+-transporting NADH:ubiquinone oxidoreductase subunit NqrA
MAVKVIRVSADTRRVVFEATSRVELSEDQIAELQKQAGYHPAGYGGPIEIHHSFKRGRHHYVWACWGSCD